MQHFIIDGIGPFFRFHPEGRINWSKVPFTSIERSGRIPEDIHRQLCGDMETVCARASEWGFNTITFDDLAHVADMQVQDHALALKLEDYRHLYRELVSIASRHGLSVWFTTDIMFYTPELSHRLGTRIPRVAQFLCDLLDRLFREWPEIGGIVFRIGESDAHDVTGDFLSKLIVRTPRQGREFLRRLLPVFEQHGRKLVFRTWSVGAFRIGDLIWNRDTYRKLFKGINSHALLVSIKYGESDFFRYLKLNPQFAKDGPDRIIELQARREYEGFGEYPSFIGHDTSTYRDEVRDLPGVVGMSVWCQTGGWSAYRRLTFLDPEALWNEVNVWTCIRLFRDQVSVEGAVRSFFLIRFGNGRWDQFLELMELSEQVIKELLYTDEFALRRIYFRRLRIPPLLAVYWDHLFINGALRTIHRCFVLDGEAKIRQAQVALEKLGRMRELACDLGLPESDIVFEQDTFRLLLLARVFYFRPVTEPSIKELEEAVAAYRALYDRRGYTVSLDVKPWKVQRKRLKRLLAVILRENRRYRWIDRLFTLHVLAFLYGALRVFHRRLVPEFARKQAMGIDSIFR